MPKKHVEQGLLQLRKLASEQEPRQLVEPSRSDQATGGASMADASRSATSVPSSEGPANNNNNGRAASRAVERIMVSAQRNMPTYEQLMSTLGTGEARTVYKSQLGKSQGGWVIQTIARKWPCIVAESARGSAGHSY